MANQHQARLPLNVNPAHSLSLWTGSLKGIGAMALAIGLLLPAAHAEEGVWRTAYYDRSVPMGELGTPVEVLRSPALLAFSGTKAKLYMVGGMMDDVNLERVTLVKAAQVSDGQTTWDGSIQLPLYPITFSGKQSLAMPKRAGAPPSVPSDEISAPIVAGLWYIQQSFQKDSKSPYSFDNDGAFLAASHEAPTVLKPAGRLGAYRVDVLTTDTRPLIACCGDSITASSGATKLRGIRYPDLLGKKLNLPTINLGVNGGSFDTLVRTDIKGLAGVDVVVVLLGSNDIRGGLVKKLDDYVRNATSWSKSVQNIEGRAGKLKVVWGTIHPAVDFPTHPEREKLRQEVNAWIRGNSMGADAIVDFDKALADPKDPAKFVAEYVTADGIHPNDAGDVVLAKSAADVIQKLLAK
jgi:lysophospholipase L1-like esterase